MGREKHLCTVCHARQRYRNPSIRPPRWMAADRLAANLFRRMIPSSRQLQAGRALRATSFYINRKYPRTRATSAAPAWRSAPSCGLFGPPRSGWTTRNCGGQGSTTGNTSISETPSIGKICFDNSRRGECFFFPASPSVRFGTFHFVAKMSSCSDAKPPDCPPLCSIRNMKARCGFQLRLMSAA